MAPDPDYSTPIGKNETKLIQSIFGTIIFYARLLDTTVLFAINEIYRVQYKLMTDTLAREIMLLDYSSTYYNSILRYHDSQIIIQIYSDTAYRVMMEARS